MRFRLMVCFGMIAVLIYLGRHTFLDDAQIYDHYISNALAGHGLVFNVGERVNALTSPLYSYLLFLMSWVLRGHVWLAAMIICGVSLAAACVLAETIIPFSGLILSTMAYFYATVGMETSLLLCLILLSIRLYMVKRYDLLPVVLAFLVLTRAEAGAMILVMSWLLFKERAFPKAAAFLPVVVIFAGYIALNHHYYGSFLPSSSMAKIGQGRSGYWGEWPTSFLGFGRLVQSLWPSLKYSFFTVLCLIPFAFIGLTRLTRTRWSQAALPFALILLLFYVALNLPNYHWYYAPFILLFVLYSVGAVPKNRVGVVFLCVLAFVQGVAATRFVQKREARADNYDNVSNWIAANSKPDASVEADEIGEISQVSHRRVIDIVGLTEPKNAIHIAHRDVTSWLGEDCPDYVVIHKPTWIFERVAVASPDYEELPMHSGNVYLLQRKEGRCKK